MDLFTCSLHNPQGLNGYRGGNLRGRQNHHSGEEWLHQAPQVETRRAAAKNDGRRNRQRFTQKPLHALQHAANQRRLQGVGWTVGRLRVQNLRELFFHRRIKLDHGELSIVPEQGLNEGATQGLPRGFHQQNRVFIRRSRCRGAFPES